MRKALLLFFLSVCLAQAQITIKGHRGTTGSGGTEVDGVIGNEVKNVTDSTLTRSGSGTSGSPYTVGLNLAKYNTWTKKQTFNSGVAGNSGITFTQVNSSVTPLASNGKVLSVDASGNVVLRTDSLTSVGDGNNYTSGISFSGKTLTLNRYGLSNLQASFIMNSDSLTEGSTNLFFTNARARSALSSSATGLSYSTSTGAFSLTTGYIIPTTTEQTNWATAYNDRMKWDGGSTGLVAATGRTSLGLGDAATKNVGTGSTNVAAGDHGHSGVYEPANANIQSHIINTSNPHSVTSTQVLPSQTGSDGKYLKTNGTAVSWDTPAGGGSLDDNAVTYAKLDTAAAGWIDVRKFGAVGDSTTNNALAIRNAIKYAANQGGGTVWFTGGNTTIYGMTDTVSVFSNVTLKSDGAWIKQLGSSGIGTFKALNASNVIFDGLNIDGNYNDDHCFYAVTSYNVAVKNCKFKRTGTWSLRFSSDSSVVIDKNIFINTGNPIGIWSGKHFYVTNNIMDNRTFSKTLWGENAAGITCVGLVESYIENNVIHMPLDEYDATGCEAIYLNDATGTVSNVHITGNKIYCYADGEFGISISTANGSKDIFIIDNLISAAQGIGAIEAGGVTGLFIQNNRIRNCLTTAIAYNAAVVHSVISGNEVTNCVGFFTSTFANVNTTITNNIVKDITSHCILLNAAGKKITVANNTFSDASGYRAINIANYVDLIISGNNIDSVTQGINLTTCSRAVVSNNLITLPTQYGVYIDGVLNTSIEGNIIVKSTLSSIYANNNCKALTISYNKIRYPITTDGRGIHVKGTDNVTVTWNEILSPRSFALTFENNSTDTLRNGNISYNTIVFDSLGGASGTRAAYFGNVKRLDIIGNRFLIRHGYSGNSSTLGILNIVGNSDSLNVVGNTFQCDSAAVWQTNAIYLSNEGQDFITIRRNFVSGFLRGIYNQNARTTNIIDGNDIRNCTTPYTPASAVIVQVEVNGNLGIGTTAVTAAKTVVAGGLMADTLKTPHFKLPHDDGSSNQVMKTNGSGTLSWYSPTTGDITGVTASAPLTGGGSSGAVTVGVDTSKLATQYWVMSQEYGVGGGDITSVTAGSGLSGGAIAGDVSVDIQLSAIGGMQISGDSLGNKLDGTTLSKSSSGLKANVGTSSGTVAAGDHTHSGYVSNTLTSAYIYVGNGSNVATGVAMSGDASISNAGAITVSDDSHAHTTTTISGLDISDDTNLAAGTALVLSSDTINLSVEADGGLTAGADSLGLKLSGSALTLSSSGLAHSTADGYKHIPSTGASTQLLQYSSAGTAKWITMSGDATIADNGAMTVGDDSHAHTTTTISGLDISDDTNLAAGTALVLSSDTINLSVEADGGLTAGADSLGLKLSGSALTLSSSGLAHSTANGYIHLPASGSSAQILQYSSAGTAKWITVSGDVTIADNGAMTVGDDSHAHTTTTISGLDISDDTNLAAGTALVLSGDTINLSVEADGGLTAGADSLGLKLSGSALTLSSAGLSHSTANGYIHIPASGSSAQMLQYSSAGTAKWITVSGDVTIADNGAMTVGDDSHAHIYSDIDATTSANWANQVSDETGSGAWTFATAPTFTTSIKIGATGVKISDDGDGAITFLGESSGSDEDLTINFDDVSNEVGLSSSTGVTKINLGTIGIETGDGLNISGEAKHVRFTVMSPNSVFTADSCICIWPKLDAGITIDSLTVTTSSASYNVAGDLRFATAFIGRSGGSVGLIKAVDTSSGVLYTGTFNDATVDAGKCIYLKLDSAPSASMTQFSVDMRYRY